MGRHHPAIFKKQQSTIRDAAWQLQHHGEHPARQTMQDPGELQAGVFELACIIY